MIQKYGAENVRAVFTGSENIGRVLDGIAKNANPHDWLKESDEAVRRQVAEYVVAQSEYVRKMAKQNQLTYADRTDDFEGDMNRILGLLELPGESK